MKVLANSSNKQIAGQANYLLGKIYYQDGKYAAAIAALKKCLAVPALQRSSLRQSALQTLAKASYINNQDAQGSKYLDQYIAVAFPNGRDDTQLLRGQFLKDLALNLPAKAASRQLAGQLLKLAQTELQASIAAAPSAKAHHQLAHVHQGLRNIRAAIDACTKGLALDPDNPSIELLDLRGSLFFYRVKNGLGRAEKDYDQAIKLAPQTDQQRVMWASTAAMLGYFKAVGKKRLEAKRLAGRTMLALSSQAEKHYSVYHILASVYGELSKSDDQRRAGDQQLALDYLEEAIRRAEKANALQKELNAIDSEPAFPDSMKQLPRFQELIAPAAQ